MTKRQQVTECSVTGELRLRPAFQRRALAYDLAGVASFHSLEQWANMLFERMQADPPVGYKHVNADQVIRADKALRLKIAEETRAQVASTIDGVKVADAAIAKWSVHPQIQFHFLPLPAGQPSSSSGPKPKTSPTKPQQGKGKGKLGGKTGHKIEVPPDCEIRWGDSNKPICMKYNIGTCKPNVKPGKRCQYGYHVRWKKSCQKLLPATECPHS